MSHRILNLQSINQLQLCEEMLEAMARDDRDSLQIVTSTQNISISSKLLQIFSPLYRDIFRDIPIKDSDPVTMILPDTEAVHVQHLLDLLTSGKVHDNHWYSESILPILTLAECFKIEMRETDLTHPVHLQDMDKNPTPKIKVKNFEEMTSPIPIPCESLNNEKGKNPSNPNFDEVISIDDAEREDNSPLIALNKSLIDSTVSESTVDFSSTYEESLSASSAQYKCDDCIEAFSTSRELYEHRNESHYTFEQANSSQACLPSLTCSFPKCFEVLENGDKLKKHFSKVHEVKKEKVKRSSSYHLRCSLCRKTLSSENKLLEHQKIEHKYKCDQCSRSYVLNPDLLHHILKYHDKIESDSFTCRHCDQKFSEERIWRQHEASPHDHSCTKEECLRSFCDRRQLEIHLSQEHDVLYVTIDHILGTKGVITTQKNAASEDIAGWAEEWIRLGHNI